MTKARAEKEASAAMSAAAAPLPSDTSREDAPRTGGAGDEGARTQPAADTAPPPGAADRARPMNLLCSLGRHAPRAAPRWNDGYYFATCRRCGQDIVRTAYEGWHVPRGYRVVWAPAPPQERPAVALTPQAPAPADPQDAAPAAPPQPAPTPAAPAEPAASSPLQLPEPQQEEPQDEPTREETTTPARKRRILPIEAVLARLREERTPAAQPPEASAPPASSNRPYWDFMEEGPQPHAAPPAAPVPTGLRPAVEDDAGPPTPRPPKPPRKPWLRDALAKAVRRLVPTESNRPWVIAAAAFVIAASIAVLAVIVSPPGHPEANEVPIGETQPLFPAPAPSSATAPSAASAGAEAFVTASVLSCRDGPARQARRVRNLGRGDAVRILARDGDWVSVDHRGAQCWALARFVAAEKPLR